MTDDDKNFIYKKNIHGCMKVTISTLCYRWLINYSKHGNFELSRKEKKTKMILACIMWSEGEGILPYGGKEH